MSQNLHDEFEEYIKKLAVEISEGIFWQHLQELYTRYDDNLKNTLEISAGLREAVQDLSKGIQTAGSTAWQAQQDSKALQQKIEVQICRLEEQTENLFTHMQRLDEENRKAMLDDLVEFSQRHANRICQIMEKSCRSIDSQLSQSITAEQLQQLRIVLEQNTQSSRQLEDYINGILTDKTEESLQHIQKVMDRNIQIQIGRIKDQLATIDGIIGQILKGQGNTFSHVIASAGNQLSEQLLALLQTQKGEWERTLEERADLIRQAGPSKEKVEQLVSSGQAIEQIVKQQKDELARGRRNWENAGERIKKLERSMDSFLKQAQINDKRFKELAEEQQKQLQQAEKDRKTQTMFILCSSILTVILLVLLIFFQPPSFFWGIVMILSAFIIWYFVARKKKPRER